MSAPTLERVPTLDDLYWAAAELLKEQAAVSYRTPAPTFRDFIRDAWPLLEPVSPFVDGWHIGAIAEHLTAIADGELRNLIINIPPRSGKSSLVSVLWPAWVWIEHPEKRWLFASYAASLSVRDSVKCRRLIESDWYQAYWGDRYQLTSDTNTKAVYENNRTGLRLSTSVGGQGTGQGGDVLVVDDPTSAEQADSDAKRIGANEWYDGTMSTRGNDPATVARVLIMQRLHQSDLTGHILDTMALGGEQYDHLILPAEYEPRAQLCLADLDHDPRTEAGEPLSPERFGPEILATLKVSLGPERAAGQLQQRPAPPGGAIFRRDWWEERGRYDADDPLWDMKVKERWLTYDTAYRETIDADYTGCAVFEILHDKRLALRWVWKERLEMPRLLAAIERDAQRWNHDGKLKRIIIEDAGSGMSAAQTLSASANPIFRQKIFKHKPKDSKEYRARNASLWCERGAVLLPLETERTPWMWDFAGPEGDLFRFPTIEHDDTVDAFVQGILQAAPYCLDQWNRNQHRIGVVA
jgi:phage terminase large subunit-like protein